MKKGVAAAVLAIGVIVFGLWNAGIITEALFDSEKAVRMDYSTLNAVENSTLIIGTHLIYLHALSDELYKIAMDSASASGQDRIYYKSELAGGIWYDITDAGSIMDITSSGSIASQGELEALYFTHHTKSDKITYELVNNKAVCIFDIDVLYDLENMEELEALKIQYDTMKQSKISTKTAKRNLEFIKKFFAMKVDSNTTKECDRQIEALNGYYRELVANNANEKDTDIVLKVMEKIDNARKAAVFQMVDTGLSNLQDQVASVGGEDGGDSELDIDDVLLTAIGNSQYTLSESMNAAQGNMLAQGSTVISEMEYTLANQMVQNAESGNYAGCDEQNKKLQYLDNISEERIVSREEELKLLGDLISRADLKFILSLSAGETQAYRDLVARSASHAALKNQIKEDTANANAVKTELQFLLKGKADREAQQEAETFILQRIQDAVKFRAVIGLDAYAQGYQDIIALHVSWLEDLLSDLKKNGNVQSEEESLYEQKANLQEEKLKALDSLNLDTAKRIDAQIAAVDQKIGAMESEGSGNLQNLMQQKAQIEKTLESNPEDAALQVQLGSLEMQIAKISTDLEENSQAANIMDSKKEIMALLAGDDTSQQALDTIANHVNVLTDQINSGSPLALEAGKEVYQKMIAKSELEGESAFLPFQDAIEEAIVESTVQGSAQAGLSGELSMQAALNVVVEHIEADSLTDEEGNIATDVSEQDIAAVLIALGEYGQMTKKMPGSQTEGSSGEGQTEGTGTSTGDNQGQDTTQTEEDKQEQDKTQKDDSSQDQDSSQKDKDKKEDNQGQDTAQTEEDKQEQDKTQKDDSSQDQDNPQKDKKEDNQGQDTAQIDGNKQNTQDTTQLDDNKVDNDSSSSSGNSQGNSIFTDFVQGCATALSQNGAGNIFPIKKQDGTSYVPAKNLAEYAGYRYVWNDTQMNAILSRGRIFYSFQAFQQRVDMQDEGVEYMDVPAGFSGVIYIPETFVTAHFGCSIYEIPGTEYAVLVDDSVVEKAQDILSDLLEG